LVFPMPTFCALQRNAMNREVVRSNNCFIIGSFECIAKKQHVFCMVTTQKIHYPSYYNVL
jgi:hypothetical protein